MMLYIRWFKKNHRSFFLFFFFFLHFLYSLPLIRGKSQDHPTLKCTPAALLKNVLCVGNWTRIFKKV
jgi:hypothetical protein